MYKMIVLDLDGTLLNDYKEISKENIEMIRKAYIEKGVISVIATGRPYGYAKDICSLDSDIFADYVIACDGAIIKNIKTNDYLKRETLSKEEVLEIRKLFLEEESEYMMIYTEEKVLTETLNDIGIGKSGIKSKEKKEKVRSIEDILENNPSLDVFLCLIGASEDKLKRIISKIQRNNDIENTDICTYLYKSEGETIESKYIDLVRKGSTKKNAIQILAEKLNIKQEEIIVMGDGGNDVSMFEMAGLKIAMGNAEEYLKEKADFITTSNNDNGVAKAIEKVIFSENN